MAQIRVYKDHKGAKSQWWVGYKKETLSGPFSSDKEALQAKSEWLHYPYDLKSNGGY